MKRVFIIHGWDGSPEANWLPWMKAELEKRGYEVIVPAMPETNHPKIDEWVSHLAEVVGTPDQETYFIGHSIGCQAVARYLAGVTQSTAGVLFVAGWFTLTGLETPEEVEIAKPWIEKPIDDTAFRKNAGKIVALFSDNDSNVPLENVNLFKERFGARTIVEKNAGHFTGEETGVMEFPIILSTFLELADENSSNSN